MAISFDTAAYKRNHMSEPRGRGAWAFGLSQNPDVTGEDILWSPSMTLADAKKWARAEIKTRFGADASGTLYIQP